MGVTRSSVLKGKTVTLDDRILSRRELRSSIRRLLDQLGNSPTEIASNLASLDVRGCRKNTSNCAIARYLGAVIGGEQSIVGISVTERTLYVSRVGRAWPLWVRFPKAVSTFISAFDQGCYPELLDPIGSVAGDVRK